MIFNQGLNACMYNTVYTRISIDNQVIDMFRRMCQLLTPKCICIGNMSLFVKHT